MGEQKDGAPVELAAATEYRDGSDKLEAGISPAEACDDDQGYGFHCVVLAKYFIMDIPQQICIILYLLGWYEAEGLRCQLCLFHPEHCGEEHPFRWVNMLAIACCLGSCISNQFLVRQADLKVYTEDDMCWYYTFRIGGVCLSILPFTTGIFWASSALLSTPVFVQVISF